ncbi:MAG: multicopper oxidase domain-containing protein [Cytophagaceae bacterium]|nr:multicopper oxidase domain-containing protein [Gemmatimonadaceae bacterium]
MSHGEAPVGTVADAAPVDPGAPPRSARRVVQVRFEMRDTLIEISRGVMYRAWTFAGSVPGPVIRVTQGDSVDFTLVNRAPMPHSMDFHAAQIAPNKYYVNVMPNDSIRFQFIAEVPGAFMYHCGTAPVAAHIANGMYGALIVDPRTPRPAAREMVFVQSEFYLTPDPTANPKSLSWERLLSLAPDYVTFNGRSAQYAEHPISVKVGELLRLYVVNGPIARRPSMWSAASSSGCSSTGHWQTRSPVCRPWRCRLVVDRSSRSGSRRPGSIRLSRTPSPMPPRGALAS